MPALDRDCPLCPRLVEFRCQNRASFPDWHNAPVEPFGDAGASLLIVGLAPGLRGANRTGRPFTGDYAGDLLFQSLLEFGLAKGHYDRRADDSLELIDCRISNAVKCVPPENKPLGNEIILCNRFLKSEIESMPRLRAILALGSIAHESILRALGKKRASMKFSHGAIHELGGSLHLYDSYHCSRYNTNTRRLTTEMFHACIQAASEWARKTA